MLRTRDFSLGKIILNLRCLLYNSYPMQGNSGLSWILDCTPWIPILRYWIPVFVSGTWILDSNL